MRFTALLEDDDAVSPVIGVILMVAITVILAAVIGTFVLDLGGTVETTPPQAQFTFEEYDDGGTPTVDVTHDGGEAVDASNVEVVGATGGTPCGWSNLDGSSRITSGSQCTGVEVDGSGTLRVTWESDDGSRSDTLATYDYDN